MKSSTLLKLCALFVGMNAASSAPGVELDLVLDTHTILSCEGAAGALYIVTDEPYVLIVPLSPTYGTVTYRITKNDTGDRIIAGIERQKGSFVYSDVIAVESELIVPVYIQKDRGVYLFDEPGQYIIEASIKQITRDGVNRYYAEPDTINVVESSYWESAVRDMTSGRDRVLLPNSHRIPEIEVTEEIQGAYNRLLGYHWYGFNIETNIVQEKHDKIEQRRIEHDIVNLVDQETIPFYIYTLVMGKLSGEADLYLDLGNGVKFAMW